jgi:hypothetical protein
MFRYQVFETLSTMLYTDMDNFMWIAVNKLQLSTQTNLCVDKLSGLQKLYTYCPHRLKSYNGTVL